MKTRIQRTLRRLASTVARLGRYRYLRAHLWDAAVRELHSGSCT